MAVHRLVGVHGTVDPLCKIDGRLGLPRSGKIADAAALQRVGGIVDSQTDHILPGSGNGRQQLYSAQRNSLGRLSCRQSGGQFLYLFPGKHTDGLHHIGAGITKSVQGTNHSGIGSENAHQLPSLLQIGNQFHISEAYRS